MGKNGFYAVRVGRVPGVYSDWNTCMLQTGGYSGAVFRGFKTRDEADAWLREPETSSFAVQQAAHAGVGVRVPSGLCPVSTFGEGSLVALHGQSSDGQSQLGSAGRSSEARALGEESQCGKRSKLTDSASVWRLWFDGCSRGNPGPAGGGVLIVNELGVVIYKAGVGFGFGTNNMAEYRALITGMRIAVNLGAECLLAQGDSQLIVCQINGEYKVGSEMAPYHREVLLLSQYLRNFRVRWIPRIENNVADSLAAYGVAQASVLPV